MLRAIRYIGKKGGIEHNLPDTPGVPCDLEDASARYTSWMDMASIPKADSEAKEAAHSSLCEPITLCEFKKHLHKKAGMPAGLDGCTWELLQALPEPAILRVFETMRSFLMEGLD